MALIKCPECGTEVSEFALACPKCAYPIKDKVDEIKASQSEEEKKEETEKQPTAGTPTPQSSSTSNVKIFPIFLAALLAVLIIYFLIGIFGGKEKEQEDDTSSEYSLIADSLYSARLKQYRLDSAANAETITKLKPFFSYTKDDFNSSTWVRPKSAPAYTNQNGFFLYFSLSPIKVASNLRLRIQYTAYDWLFFHTVHFAVDQQGNGDYINFSYTPLKTETDCGNGGQIWEWSDENIDGEIAMLSAIRTAKKVKMKFDGQQYSKEMSLTKQQIKDIDRTMALYYAYGGK